LSVIPIVLIQISLLFSFKDVEKSSVIITTTISIIIALTVGVLATFISRYLGKIIDKQKTLIDDSEKAIKMGEEKYLNLFRTMAQGVVYQDSEGKIIEVNPAAEELLGLTFDQMQGRTSIDPRWKSIDMEGNDLPGDRHPAMLALKNGTEVRNFIMGVYNPKSDQQVWIIVNSIPIFSEGEEKPRQVFSTFLDITDLKKLNDEKQRLKDEFEKQVIEKTKELNQQISELEHFFQVTIERELRMEELRKDIELLKKQINNERNTQI
jgi:PAS domain S-box-containing protein